MFYLIDATTKGVVEGGREVAEKRPPWLGVLAFHNVSDRCPPLLTERNIRKIWC